MSTASVGIRFVIHFHHYLKGLSPTKRHESMKDLRDFTADDVFLQQLGSTIHSISKLKAYNGCGLIFTIVRQYRG